MIRHLALAALFLGAATTLHAQPQVDFEKEQITTVHVPPAHTDGDAIVHFRKANVLHMGDTFDKGMYPFIDTSSGGNLDGMIHATEVGLSMADEKTRIIPGHGELAARADLVAFHDMLVEVRRRLVALVQEGVSVEDAVARRPLADLEETWASQFLNGDTFIRIVYPGLGK